MDALNSSCTLLKLNPLFTNGFFLLVIISDTMVNLSDLFGGKVRVDVDPGKCSLDDEILDEYMDQEWRQEFLASEVG